MGIFANFYNFITDKSLSVPLGELMIFIIFISMFLLYGRHKLGLICTFCFVLYWGFFINFRYFLTILDETTIGMPLYIFSGIAMLMLIITDFFLESSD